MASLVSCNINEVLRGYLGHAEVHLVRRASMEASFTKFRVGVLGAMGVGKSTLIGSITSGTLDDGNGKTRRNVMTHQHELFQGRSTSVALIDVHINKDKQIVCRNGMNNVFASEQPVLSSQIVCLLDFPGSSSSLNTVLKGILTHNLHGALICLSARGLMEDDGESKYAMAYLKLLIHLDICPWVVVTKCDMSQYSLKVLETKAALVFPEETKCYFVSNITGLGFESLLKSLCEPLMTPEPDETNTPMMMVRRIFLSVTSTLDIVVGGVVLQGVIEIGSTLQLGPDRHGVFIPVRIQSIRTDFGLSVQRASKNSIITVAIKPHVKATELPSFVGKGAYLVHSVNPRFWRRSCRFYPSQGFDDNGTACTKFTSNSQVVLLTHNTQGNVTTVDSLGTHLHLEFKRHMFIPIGSTAIIRQGRHFIVGRVG